MKNDNFRNLVGLRSVNPVQLPVGWYCILTVVSSPKNPQNRRWKSRLALSLLCSYRSGNPFDGFCKKHWYHGKKKKNQSSICEMMKWRKARDSGDAYLASRMPSDTARATRSGWRFLRSRRTRSVCSYWWQDYSTSWGRIWHRFLPLWEAGRCSQR